MVTNSIYKGVYLICLREFDNVDYMNKLFVICTVLFLSSCNLTSKDFYTTEPVLTGVIIGTLISIF